MKAPKTSLGAVLQAVSLTAMLLMAVIGLASFAAPRIVFVTWRGAAWVLWALRVNAAILLVAGLLRAWSGRAKAPAANRRLAGAGGAFKPR